MIGRSSESLNAYDTLEHRPRKRVVRRGRHDPRAVDEVDTSCQCDVLPDLRFTRDGCDFGDFAALQRIDNTALADIRIPNEADGNLFFV
jgi:hypothetical protein